MGFFHPITIRGPLGQEIVEALVSTSESFSAMPVAMLDRLGVQPYRRVSLQRADGESAEWDLGRMHSTIDGSEEPDLCIFDSDEKVPIIGRYTLEARLLEADFFE